MVDEAGLENLVDNPSKFAFKEWGVENVGTCMFDGWEGRWFFGYFCEDVEVLSHLNSSRLSQKVMRERIVLDSQGCQDVGG
jgi:hypothetical protein